ncbi:unnamed protein product [Lasius platythorax]|uniref:Uncharacterized protein n=1 Tax=Lasius platythorax TaxID=488582 RepID=A0AAV2N6L1_9HYME
MYTGYSERLEKGRRGKGNKKGERIRFSPEVTFAFRTRLLRYGGQSKENKNGEERKKKKKKKKKKRKKRKGRQRGTQSTTTETIRGAG